MKKIYIILLLLFSTQISSAQKWCAPGATWYYTDIVVHIPLDAYTRFKAIGDTIIQGKICDVIEVLDTGSYFFSPFSHLEYEYTYADSNIVYQFKNNHFYKLYDFNAQPGDHWEIYGDTSFCPFAPAVIVDSIGTTILNGDTLKVMWTSAYNGSPFLLSNKIVEKIGCNGFLFPIGGCMVDFLVYDFRCYSDSSGWSYETGVVPTCDFLIGIEELSHELFNVYPNPVKSEINIELGEIKHEPAAYRIYNLFGEEILSGELKEKKSAIDFSEFSPGVYFINVVSAEGVSTQKIIKL